MATTDEGVVTPPLSNAPNVPADMQAMATSVTKKLIPSFVNSAARVITSPADGQMTYQQDSKRLERWSAANGAWTQFLGPTVSMSRSTAQSIANNSLIGMSWDTTVFNFTGIAGTPSGITIPAAGWYRVRFAGEFIANATGRRFACILKNAAEVTSINRFTVAANTAANGTGLTLPGMKVLCAAGDVINIGVFQDSTIALNLSANATMEVELAQ